MLLPDVGASPVDAHEREYSLELAGWNRTFQVRLAFEGAEYRVAEAEAELRALAAGEVREVEDETQPLDVEGLNAVLEKHASSDDVDIVSEEYAAAVQADGVDVDDAVASSEVVLETVTVTAGDEDGTVWCFALDVRPVDLLEEAGLNEAFGQHELGIQVFHVEISSRSVVWVVK